MSVGKRNKRRDQTSPKQSSIVRHPRPFNKTRAINNNNDNKKPSTRSAIDQLTTGAIKRRFRKNKNSIKTKVNNLNQISSTIRKLHLPFSGRRRPRHAPAPCHRIAGSILQLLLVALGQKISSHVVVVGGGGGHIVGQRAADPIRFERRRKHGARVHLDALRCPASQAARFIVALCVLGVGVL